MSTEKPVGPVDLRPADTSDMAMIYDWRNDERTRRHFRHPQPVEWDVHREWFGSVLKNNACDLLIGKTSGTPFGVLRYDHDGDRCEASVYMDPEKTSNGLGTALISAGTVWISQHRPDVTQVIATIHSDNAASIRAFEKAGFAAIDGSGSFRRFERSTESPRNR